MNLRGVLVSLGLFGIIGGGCVIDVVRGPYEACPNGESCSSGTVCLTFATTVARARVCGPFGGPLASDGEPPAEADVDGPVVKVFLRRYQWLHLDVEFAS